MLISKAMPSKRFGKPKGLVKNVVHHTLSSMLKILLDPNVESPTFCAVNLARLSPVDARHVDMSAILLELQQLHAKVHAASCIRDDL